MNINLCCSLSAIFPVLTLNLARISCNDALRGITAFPILYNSFHLGYGQKAGSDVCLIKEGFLFYSRNHERESLYCCHPYLGPYSSARRQDTFFKIPLLFQSPMDALYHPKVEASGGSTSRFSSYPCIILD